MPQGFCLRDGTFISDLYLAFSVQQWHTYQMNSESSQQRPFPGFTRSLDGLPYLPELCRADFSRPVPDDTACFALWNKYDMLPNIRRHSLLVAHVATTLARRASELGFVVNIDEVHASGLLHDIAKTYCVRHGGSHAQVGASWVVAETHNYAIAQGVILHVWWPWPLPEGPVICSLPFFVIYADKRIQHDACVTLQERYDDLLDRYGSTKEARAGISAAYEQGQHIECALEALLGMSLHEDSFDCGRVVNGA